MRTFLKRLQVKVSPTWKRKQSINPKRCKETLTGQTQGETHQNILVKLTKTKHKKRIFKAAREKQQVTCKGNSIHLTADLSAEILPARREWQDVFKVLKGENLQPRLLYPARTSFKMDGEIKSFTEMKKLREFSTIKPALQQMLNGLIQSRNTAEEKKTTKSTPNNQKMAIGTYISIITLNANGLNAPIKRHRMAEWIQK